MSYTQMQETYRNKFARADMAQCMGALEDIAVTVLALCGHFDTAYFAKLDCERDAIHDRIAYLNRKSKCVHCDGKGYV